MFPAEQTAEQTQSIVNFLNSKEPIGKGSTKFHYALSSDARVRLQLYSVTGEKVADLLNTEMKAGYYTQELNAGSMQLASGVYLVWLVAEGGSESFVKAVKIVLMK